ncbi:MAG TPA: hypothetical protein VFB94_08185, partial [Acidimicrobiales bacterium]|nr:hypothetical protein [Acidimicrobiales bacterium]
VFVEFEVARAWVWRSRLSCTLTHYAVDVGAYDWSVASGWFTPTKPEQVEAPFIERYGGGAEHDHYTDGGSDPTTEQRVPPPLGFRPAAGLGRCRSRGPHGVAVQRAPPAGVVHLA